eukprot:CAMPEP_0119265784 /NCGR_PEP_ID=MMETSP1329-20130426/4483_1 /TAXON_ID=114041 /ORGANISM="Genus nov. species nov., Strain RCC1024" /LENGTH=146 /DNA_ID=CAMNT_0007265633 /DNA_START=180 /DNA_END=616 /DNA_ORIENTATION=-
MATPDNGPTVNQRAAPRTVAFPTNELLRCVYASLAATLEMLPASLERELGRNMPTSTHARLANIVSGAVRPSPPSAGEDTEDEDAAVFTAPSQPTTAGPHGTLRKQKPPAGGWSPAAPAEAIEEEEEDEEPPEDDIEDDEDDDEVA